MAESRTDFDEVKMTNEARGRTNTHLSTRFLTSISQILVIFEPDSNLDAKNPQNRYCTIVPSYQIENRFCTLNISLLIYIYYYIYYNIYNNIYKYNTPFLPNNHKTADGTMVRWYFSVLDSKTQVSKIKRVAEATLLKWAVSIKPYPTRDSTRIVKHTFDVAKIVQIE